MQNPSPANGSFEKALARREFDGKDPCESRVSGYGGAGTKDTHRSRNFVSPFLLVDNFADSTKSDDTGSGDNLHNEARGDQDGSFVRALGRRGFDGKYPSESHVSGYGGAGTEDTHRSRTSGSPSLVDNVADRAKSDDTGSGDNLHNEARDDHNATEADRSTLTTSTSRPIRNETARRAHQLSNIAQQLLESDDDRDKPEINAKPPKPSPGDLRPTADLISKKRSDILNLLVLDESLNPNAYECDAKSLHASPDTRPSLRLDNNQENSHRRKRSHGVSDTHSVISIVMNANKGIVTPENEWRQLGFNKEERDECPRTPELHAPEMISRQPCASIVFTSYTGDTEKKLTEGKDLKAAKTMEMMEEIFPEIKGIRHVESAIRHGGGYMLAIGMVLLIAGLLEFAPIIDVTKGKDQVADFRQLNTALTSGYQMLFAFVTICISLVHLSGSFSKTWARRSCTLLVGMAYLNWVFFLIIIIRILQGWRFSASDINTLPMILLVSNSIAGVAICSGLNSGLMELIENQKKLYSDRGIDLGANYFAFALRVYNSLMIIAGLCQVVAACYVWSARGSDTSEMASAGPIFVVSYAPMSVIVGSFQVTTGAVGVLASFGYQKPHCGFDGYVSLLIATALFTAILQFAAQISIAPGDDHVVIGVRGLVLYFGIFIMSSWAYVMKNNTTEDPKYFCIDSDLKAEPMQFGVLRLVAQVRAWRPKALVAQVRAWRPKASGKQSPRVDREITMRTTGDYDDDTVSDDAPIGDFVV